jgi:hypothetical protein
LENARETHTQWHDANAGAARYDNKLAGSHWIVKYPGTGKSFDGNGVEVENAVLAKRILDALESSGSIAIPMDVAAFVDELSKANAAWDVSILSDSASRQPAFIDRLKYLDTLKVRALLKPERTVTEGQYGTKAEAETHGDLAQTCDDMLHRHVTKAVNEQVLNPLVAINFGCRAVGKVRLKAAPIADAQKAFMRLVYQEILKNPQGFLQESAAIDTDAIKDELPPR